jgi:hypothetical protein
MRRLAILILGILIGGLAVWWYLEKHPNKTPAQIKEQVQNDTRSFGNDLRARLDSWGLNTDNIKSELQRTGKIIRQKSSEIGKKISDSTSDARITTKIKGKILADKELSAWNISVSTTDGHVTLAGKVSSEAQIGKAVLLAMETEGVKEVVSTLQVKP